MSTDIPNDAADYEPEFGRDRSKDIETADLNPGSLVGSYFRAEHEEDDLVDEGLIVGQAWTGPGAPFVIYLVEFFGHHGLGGFQQAIGLDRMLAEKWSFYDTEAWLVSRSEAPAEVKERES